MRTRGGVLLPARKDATRNRPIEPLGPLDELRVPLHQHAGSPALPILGRQAVVAAGDPIGESPPGLGARVHAPIAGVARPLTATTLPGGRRSLAVAIRARDPGFAGEAFAPAYGGTWEVPGPDALDAGDVVEAIRKAGVVGMGGAAFPTHVKLRPPRPVDTVLANGSECEPYLTADERTMIEAPAAIVAGVRLAMRATGARHGAIAVEDDKPEAIDALSREAGGDPAIRIAVLPARYPTGGERQLVRAVLDRTVPTGGLPLDVGVVVLNVQTAAAVARAVLRGAPLTHRVLTVAGGGVREPRNLFVPIGAPIGALVEACGGFAGEAVRIVAGGPMMGTTVTDLDVPVTKATSGVVVLARDEVAPSGSGPCIRCARCLEVCPQGLAPTRIARAARAGDLALARRWDLEACIECGCCAHVCPSRIPLVQEIRAGKAALRRSRQGKST